MKKLFIILTLLSYTLALKSQNLELGLQAGTALYIGEVDVNAKNAFNQLGFTGGLFARYTFLDAFAIKAQIYRGKLKANEKLYPSSDYRQQRGFSFRTPITELSAQLEYSFLRLDKDFAIEHNNPFLSLYIFGGLGITYFNPKTDYNEPNPIFDNVDADKNAIYAKSTIAIPFGGGAKIQINERIHIGGELGVRKTFSDYFDGISLLTNSSKTKDYYMISGVYVTYTLGEGVRGVHRGGNYTNFARRRAKGCPSF